MMQKSLQKATLKCYTFLMEKKLFTSKFGLKGWATTSAFVTLVGLSLFLPGVFLSATKLMITGGFFLGVGVLFVAALIILYRLRLLPITNFYETYLTSTETANYPAPLKYSEVLLAEYIPINKQTKKSLKYQVNRGSRWTASQEKRREFEDSLKIIPEITPGDMRLLVDSSEGKWAHRLSISHKAYEFLATKIQIKLITIFDDDDAFYKNYEMGREQDN